MITVIRIIHALLCIGLIATVLLQSGKSAGLSGSIAGGAESFMGKKKGIDGLLSKLTTGFAVFFIVTSLALALL